MPQASTRTSISPAPICGVGTSSTDTTDRPLYTAALIVPGTTCALASTSEAAVGNKLSKRSRRSGASPPKFEQLRGYGDWAPDRRRQNARCAEAAVRPAGRIQINTKGFPSQIGHRTDTEKWH